MERRKAKTGKGETRERDNGGAREGGLWQGAARGNMPSARGKRPEATNKRPKATQEGNGRRYEVRDKRTPATTKGQNEGGNTEHLGGRL